MQFTIADFAFDDVLQVAQGTACYPVNLRITAKDAAAGNNLTGPGIYLLRENRECDAVIYVGIWNDLREPVNKGRLWKHVSTLTLRGEGVAKQTTSIAKLDLSAKGKVIDLLQRCPEPNNSLVEALENLIEKNGVENQFYRQSVGLQLSYKRAAYANHFWDSFSNNDGHAAENIGKHFRFSYLKLMNIGRAVAKRKLELKRIERLLVERIKPLVNNESSNPLDFCENNNPRYDIKTIKEILRNA